MTREELKDLLMLATMHTHMIARKVSEGAFESGMAHFIARHIDRPEMAGIEEDAELNAICEERADMPSVAVKLEDL